ncbi:sugar ABC transporter permease [Polycladomyces sp. WAk]|uniref:Sugar ABC transporter permease n=1 Tax=Polycladomyces zharkentensis TaxID=2807616 RepID=A0ABS2WH50_9BACL|nr:sugar ABC transporter permease [Polycladomyces sp. WAk]MBN2908765.1 sugar ABC transporter permease [Polycladomyces sp. WAk]
MKTGKRMGLSERSIGYLFVLPTLIIILLIAIWPVIRSFWISLHDVRLNNPAKTEVHGQYGIDMEEYLNNAPFLISALDSEIQHAHAQKDRLQAVRDDVQKLNDLLNREKGVKERYDQVNDLLTDFKPVPPDLKYANIQNETAQKVKQSLSHIRSELEDLKKQGVLQKPKDVIGLVDGLQSALISPNYVGLQYYRQFAQDPRMWASLENTLVFTVISVTLELVFGLWIALLLNKQFLGRGWVRASVLIPWAIPTVISALMWKFLFDGQNGIVAKLFEVLHIIPNMGELLTTKWGSMFAIIVADVWKTTPFMALLLLAGLQTIPQSLYEAAEVDGASRYQQFVKITLPLLKPTILVALLFRTLDAFRIFDLVFVLTGGGPGNATETISIYAYKTMFAQMNFGAGSALSVIVFFCVAVISMIFVKVLGTDLVPSGRSK